MRRDVFQAIADPTRREIIQLITQGTMNLNKVAGNFKISRPAISKHIKILTECGLIEIKQEGRERYCEARMEKLQEVADWIEPYQQFWNKQLDALENYLEKIQVKPSSESTDKKKKKRVKKSSH